MTLIWICLFWLDLKWIIRHWIDLDSDPLVVDQLDSSEAELQKEADEPEEGSPGLLVFAIPTENQNCLIVQVLKTFNTLTVQANQGRIQLSLKMQNFEFCSRLNFRLYVMLGIQYIKNLHRILICTLL